MMALKILIVCLGNICRSPAAEAILASYFEKQGRDDVLVDSCGIGQWHVGRLPDPRMQEAARKRGYVLASRARVLSDEDLDEFDLIFAVDEDIFDALHQQASSTDQKGKIQLLTAYSTCYQGKAVPDPYEGKVFEFEHVLDIIEDACQGIAEKYK
jgi:protein-tyrosine phosphatase